MRASGHAWRIFFRPTGRARLLFFRPLETGPATIIDFEQAAQIHKRIEKVNAIHSGSRHGDCGDSRVQRSGGYAGCKSGRSGFGHLFERIIGRSRWISPLAIEESRSRSLDQRTSRTLTRATHENTRADGSASSKSRLFPRWYYSSWRDGEWFPFVTLVDLNYRRLVREISKLAEAR